MKRKDHANQLTPGLAGVIRVLRQHGAELRARGVRHLFVFGSVARGDENEQSDIDLAVEFDPRQKPGLLAMVRLQRQLATLLGRKVDLVTLPHTRETGPGPS